jgi:hypothetical protein
MMNPAEDTSHVGRFTLPVEQSLRGAGWRPGRQVDKSRLEQWYVLKMTSMPGYIRIFPKALRILREFGDLIVRQNRRGITSYRETFRINPLELPVSLEDRWITYEWLLEDTLFPLGVSDMAHETALAVASNGKIFNLNVYGTGIWFVGQNFEQALETLIVGVSPVQMHITQYDRKAAEATRVQQAVRRLFADPQEGPATNAGFPPKHFAHKQMCVKQTRLSDSYYPRLISERLD